MMTLPGGALIASRMDLRRCAADWPVVSSISRRASGPDRTFETRAPAWARMSPLAVTGSSRRRETTSSGGRARSGLERCVYAGVRDSVYVSEAVQRAGVGRALLESCCAEPRTQDLATRRASSRRTVPPAPHYACGFRRSASARFGKLAASGATSCCWNDEAGDRVMHRSAGPVRRSRKSGSDPGTWLRRTLQ